MKTLEYKFVDKSVWGNGEWVNEPDKIQWQDKETSLPCLIVRNIEVTGSLCGYVGIPQRHPYYGKHYNECSLPTAKPRGKKKIDEDLLSGAKLGSITLPPMPKSWIKKDEARLVCGEEEYCDHRPEHSLDVHGGLTFSYFCQDDPSGVCHKPDAGEPDNVWWLGFDCSHFRDISPKMNARMRSYMPSNLMGSFGETYKNIAYVMNECTQLARQLKALS